MGPCGRSDGPLRRPTADTHKRIYGTTVSLRSLGIRVAGRSSRLAINCRTSAEILGWSLGLLAGQRVDGMDEGLETLSGCRSDVHGSLSEVFALSPVPVGWHGNRGSPN
jgi:hypothetical protein